MTMLVASMAEFTSSHYDVVIVGAGMVGGATACLLAQSEHKAAEKLKIALIESRAPQAFDPSQFDPRVAALTENTRMSLQRCGVWEAICAKRATPYQAMQVWDAEGTGRISFDCRQVHQPNLGHIVEVSAINSSLMDRLQQLSNIDLYCPAVVNNYTAEEDSVILDLSSGAHISANLLIAADGANSSIRQQFQFATRQWDYGQQAIVTTITTQQSNQQTAWQRFMPSGPLALLPLTDNKDELHRCSIVWSQDSEEAERLMALSDRDFCQQLSTASEHCLGEVLQTDKRHTFSLRQCHAIDYVKPRVALVGDAAHSIHPLAGQGVNLGFADAQVLAEELSRARARDVDLGDLAVLKRYQRRRKPDNLAAMATMEAFKRLFGAENLGLRLMRNYGMSAVNQFTPLKNQLIKKAMGL